MTTLDQLLPEGLIWRLGWTLVHFIWQGLAIAVLAAALFWLLRRRSAGGRYVVGCFALSLCVAAVIATFMLVPAPRHVPEMMRAWVSVPVATSQPAAAPLGTPQGETVSMPVSITPERGAAGFSPRGADALAKVPPVREIARAEARGSLLNRLRAFATSIEPHLAWIVAGWLVGILLLSVRLLHGWLGVQRIRRRFVTPVADHCQRVLSDLSQRLRVSRTVRLLTSALVQVPVTIGWLRPVILLPVSALTGLSEDQLRAVLAHELAHIRRYDYLVNLLQSVVETLLFYHPAVWWLSRRIRIEREHCCDDLAVACCGDRLLYARTLAAMEELRGAPQLAAAVTGGRLLDRIRRIVGLPMPDRAGSMPWLAGMVGIVLLAGSLLGVSLRASASNIGEQPRLDNSSSASGSIVRLTDGGTVELIAVTHLNNSSAPRSWWAPDGTPLASEPYPRTVPSNNIPGSYEFVLRMPRGAHCMVAREGHPLVEGRVPIDRAGQEVAELRKLELSGLGKDRTEASFELALATGRWQTSETWETRLPWAEGRPATHTLSNRSDVVLVWPQAEPQGAGLFLDVTFRLSDREQMRVVAIDRTGRLFHADPQVLGRGGDLVTQRYRFGKLDLKNLKRLELQKRPYTTRIRFRSVSLSPAHRTRVQSSATHERTTTRPSDAPAAAPRSAVHRGPAIFDRYVTELKDYREAEKHLSEQLERLLKDKQQLMEQLPPGTAQGLNIVGETLIALAAQGTQLEQEKLQAKSIYDNLIALDPSQIAVTPEMQMMIEQDPRISMLRQNKSAYETELEAAAQQDGSNHRTVKAIEKRIEIFDRQLQEALQKKEKEVRDYQVNSAYTRYLNALQAEVQLRERMAEQEARQRDSDLAHERFKQIEHRQQQLMAELNQIQQYRNQLQLMMTEGRLPAATQPAATAPAATAPAGESNRDDQIPSFERLTQLQERLEQAEMLLQLEPDTRDTDSPRRKKLRAEISELQAQIERLARVFPTESSVRWALPAPGLPSRFGTYEPFALPRLVTTRPVVDTSRPVMPGTLQVAVETRFAFVSTSQDERLRKKYPTSVLNRIAGAATQPVGAAGGELNEYEGGFLAETQLAGLLAELKTQSAPMPDMPRLLVFDDRPGSINLPPSIKRVRLPVVRAAEAQKFAEYVLPPRYQLHVRPSLSPDRKYVTLRAAVTYTDLDSEDDQHIAEEAKANLNVLLPDKGIALLRLPVHRSRVAGLRPNTGEGNDGAADWELVQEAVESSESQEFLYVLLRATVILPLATDTPPALPELAPAVTRKPAAESPARNPAATQPTAKLTPRHFTRLGFHPGALPEATPATQPATRPSSQVEQRRTSSRVYDVQDIVVQMHTESTDVQDDISVADALAMQAHRLEALIKRLIEPGTWEEEGSAESRPGLVHYWNDRLIIRHNALVHRKLVEIFQRLRSKDRQGPFEKRFLRAVERLDLKSFIERDSDLLPDQAGTWFFDNPQGDAEQMAIYPDGRVVVLYSNGHRDETRLVADTIELAEYGGLKTTMRLLDDGSILQTSQEARGLAKIWKRIDNTPRMQLLQPLTGSSTLQLATQPSGGHSDHAPRSQSRPAESSQPAAEALSRPLGHVVIPRGTPLEGFLQVIRERGGLTIQVDWEALQRVGVNRATGVVLNMGSTDVKTALETVLDQIGRLDYEISAGVLLISTKQKLTYSRVYDIRDMMEHALAFVLPSNVSDEAREQRTQETAQELETLFRTLVAPGTWDEQASGTQTRGSLQIWNDRLIVRHTVSVHRRLVELLAQLRKSKPPVGILQPP